MSEIGNKLIDAMEEAVAIAKGKQAAPRITINGHVYVPEAEVKRLQAAIRWVLGEAPDHNGNWFGDHVLENGRPKLYWWRAHLRNLARLQDQQKQEQANEAKMHD